MKTCPGGAMWVTTRPMRTTVEGSKTFLFPHLHFLLGMNGDQIIVAAKVSTDVSVGEAVLLVLLWCYCCGVVRSMSAEETVSVHLIVSLQADTYSTL